MTALPSYTIAGHTITCPVEVRDASAGTVTFEVDAARAQDLVPGDSFDVAETAPGRAQLTLAVIDYRDNDLGDYAEVGITTFVQPRGIEGAETGTFITHLPVDQQFTCDAGQAIWGFPKTVETIDFEWADTYLGTRLIMDGELLFELTLPRGGKDDMEPMTMTTYTYIDGRPHATAFTQGGSGSQVIAGDEKFDIVMGDHPLARVLVRMGVPAQVQFTTWTERMQGRFDAPTPL